MVVKETNSVEAFGDHKIRFVSSGDSGIDEENLYLFAQNYKDMIISNTDKDGNEMINTTDVDRFALEF